MKNVRNVSHDKMWISHTLCDFLLLTVMIPSVTFVMHRYRLKKILNYYCYFPPVFY